MQQRVFHGDLTPDDLAIALVGEFSRGDLRAQKVGTPDKVIVQIATPSNRAAGGNTSLAVSIQKIDDGVMVAMGEQEWLGVAASLGKTAVSALLNPLNLLGRIDDVAADVDALQLPEKVWAAIDRFARSVSASSEISDRLRTTACPYCNTANAVGAAVCVQCGAPLGSVQPDSCSTCGFVNAKEAKFCSNCGAKLGDHQDPKGLRDP